MVKLRSGFASRMPLMCASDPIIMALRPDVNSSTLFSSFCVKAPGAM